MPSKPRNFQIGHSYHITTRCNNREFKLSRRECREVFLYAIKKVSTKYNLSEHRYSYPGKYMNYIKGLPTAISRGLISSLHGDL